MRLSRQSGFSLVETIAAMALMAFVLMSIAGLFTLGGRQVRAGRASSEALAIGREILEELSVGAFTETWQRFDPSAAFASPSYVADTDASDTEACLRWRAVARERLGPNARAAIRIDALDGSGAPPNLDAGVRNVRITVTVTWNESARSRRVTVVTVRT